ncbi:MAG: LCP family protein [Candidatus Nanogingivalis sp.]
MKKNQQSIDGFTPRRRRTEINQKVVSKAQKTENAPARRRESNSKKDEISKKIIHQDEINEALANIEIGSFDDSKKTHHSREISKKDRKDQKVRKKFEKFNQKREKKGKKTLSFGQFKFRRISKRIFALILAAVIGYFIYNGLRLINEFIRTTKDGNIFGLLQKEKLKQDSNGRTNFLIFGTSPKGWDGEDLTDSVIVASVNQETKKAHTISLPRDLWVKHTCTGWLGTTSGKLNETYGCGKFSEGLNISDEKTAETNGQKALASTVTEVTGLDIHYVVHANWQVLVQAIDAVGGIDVKIEVWDGSPYMYDVATNIRYKNGETVHMNGEQALAFSRARGSAGGYGLSGGNFDRERNQQKIIQATLAKINDSKFDVSKLLGISTALGNNVQTTFETKELQTLADLAIGMSAGNIKSLPLVNDQDSAQNLLTTDMVGSASAVVPVAGLYDYSAIQAYIAKNTISNEIIDENAKVVVLNGTQISGLAAEQKAKLVKENYNIVEIDSAPTQDYKTTKIFAINSEKSATIKKLESKFGVSSSSSLPSEFSKYKQSADIVIVLGEE